ncbi:MAG: hypothetical protein WD072_01830 [Pirellulales bacterium]
MAEEISAGERRQDHLLGNFADGSILFEGTDFGRLSGRLAIFRGQREALTAPDGAGIGAGFPVTAA